MEQTTRYETAFGLAGRDVRWRDHDGTWRFGRCVGHVVTNPGLLVMAHFDQLGEPTRELYAVEHLDRQGRVVLPVEPLAQQQELGR